MQFLGSEFAAFKIVGSTFQLSHKIESGGNVKKIILYAIPSLPTAKCIILWNEGTLRNEKSFAKLRNNYNIFNRFHEKMGF